MTEHSSLLLLLLRLRSEEACRRLGSSEEAAASGSQDCRSCSRPLPICRVILEAKLFNRFVLVLLHAGDALVSGVDALLTAGLHHGVGTRGRVELNGGADGRLLLAESARCSSERRSGLTSERHSGRSEEAGTGRLACGRSEEASTRRHRWHAEG